MTALAFKSAGTFTGDPVASRAFKLHKERVYDNGGVILNPTRCARYCALLAKYGYTHGFAVLPHGGVRYLDGAIETYFGLLDTDIANPFLPNTSSWRDFDAVTDNGFDAMEYESGETASYPASTSLITVASSIVMASVVRSPNANTATEGYLIVKGPTGSAHVARRYSISNEPSGGASRMRCRVGTSVYGTAYGAVKAGLNRQKVGVLHCDAANIRAIEDGAVFATTATALLLPESYEVRIGNEASGTGGYSARPGEAYFGPQFAIPEGSQTFALELASVLADEYE